MKIKKIIKRILGPSCINRVKKIGCLLKYRYYSFKTKKYNVTQLKILNFDETVETIIKEKRSIVRFGDGEFKWLLNIKQEGSFQIENIELANSLRETLKSNNNTLICIPYVFINDANYSLEAKVFWKKFIYKYYNKLANLFDVEKIYGNASISRCYMDYEDKSISMRCFEKIRSIWENRDIVIVEGENTKFGVNNDFISNASSIKRIICPSKNAFEKYKEIYNECKKIDKNTLFLIALGPTATVLAGDLAKLGYQALDIGHSDIEYEWFKVGAKQKQEVFGKEVNESLQLNKDFKVLEDDKYGKSIIARII
jgi:glycosyltransferase family protein